MVTIKKLKAEFDKRNHRYGEELTTNNYDDDGVIINRKIPTLTTKYCEIGFNDPIIYLVFIAKSDSWSKGFFDEIKKISNVKIYGLKNFLKDYDISKDLESEIKAEPYFQMQFSFQNADSLTETELLNQYDSIIELLENHRIAIINQLENKIVVATQEVVTDKDFLIKAIEKAKESVARGGFPAGAVVVKNGQIIGSGISVGNLLNDPTSHGEMASIRDACKNLQTSDLSGSVLYASMEPCVMCLGASMWASISKIVFACPKEKVSEEYYGGHYKSPEINEDLSRPIEFIHLADLEEESLKVVKNWEMSLEKRD